MSDIILLSDNVKDKEKGVDNFCGVLYVSGAIPNAFQERRKNFAKFFPSATASSGLQRS
jgi:hypothetical protein